MQLLELTIAIISFAGATFGAMLVIFSKSSIKLDRWPFWILAIATATVGIAVVLDFNDSVSSQNSIAISPHENISAINIENKIAVLNISIDGHQIVVTSDSIRDIATTLRQTSEALDYSNIELLVAELVDEYQLKSEIPPNRHLAFTEGDISYWVEQTLSPDRYRLEFAARKLILDAAQSEGVVIKDQGTLSWAAQHIIADIILAKTH